MSPNVGLTTGQYQKIIFWKTRYIRVTKNMDWSICFQILQKIQIAILLSMQNLSASQKEAENIRRGKK